MVIDSSGYRGGGVLVTFCYHGNRGYSSGYRDLVTFCYHGNRGTSSGYRGGGVLVTFCHHGN